MSLSAISITMIGAVFSAPISRTIPTIRLNTCDGIIDECLLNSPYIIRQYQDQRVMSWTEARELCFDSTDENVDGMATLDTSPQAIAVTSLDEQFAFLREICANLENDDGRKVNCWIGGKINENSDGYIFSSEDTHRPDYTPTLYDPTRWGCVRNKDGSCKKDIEGDPTNDENYLVLFNNRDYYFADWPLNGGTNLDFQVTAVVCNNKAFSYTNRCQCFCDSCDIYGDVHINTFDGVSFDSLGQCVYHAVIPCAINEFNADFPIEISAENTECFDGFSSCLRAVYVSFYDASAALQTVIQLTHIIKQGVIKTEVTYLQEGALQLSGTVALDEAQTWIETPSYDTEPWAFVLTKANEEYELAIWTHSAYQTARVHFRDLFGADQHSLHLAALRITLSSCFAGTTCGMCGYYDGDIHNELVIYDAPLTTITTSADLSNIFDHETEDILYEFSTAWVNMERSRSLAEDCNDKSPPNLCSIYYCDDYCVCEGADTSYNTTKEIQCNYDLAACLMLIEGTIPCIEFQYKTITEQNLYLAVNAPHCLHLVEMYCCYHPFCSMPPDYCLRDTDPVDTDHPTLVTTTPTLYPTPEPTDRPSPLPTMAPTAGPTRSPIRKPTGAPTEYPTLSPIVDSLCGEKGIDIVLLVDNSCGLSTNECKKRQHGISNLVASVKDGSDPRIAYVTFADGEDSVRTWISLEDMEYNDAANRKDLIQYIKKMDCGAFVNNTALKYGIDAALEELRVHSVRDSDKKIVIISNCEDNTDGFDACSLMEHSDSLRIHGRSVEITVVNIPVVNPNTNDLMSNSYLECLSEGEPERFIIISDLNKISFDVNIARFVTAVCEKDTPTRLPSATPTTRPTDKPTLAPLDAHPSINVCSFHGDADVMFLVDTTCGLTDVMCLHKRRFVSELVQSIKIAHNPRVALLECGDSFGSKYALKLSDESFNNINDNTQLSEEEREDLYFNKIETRLQCLHGSGIPKGQCLSDAVGIFTLESDPGRIRKIVYIQICSHTNGEEACNSKVELYNNNIEIIVVNIGELISDQYNDCLFHNGAYNLYRFDDFDFKSAQDIETKTALIDHVCTSNPFEIGETTVTPTTTRWPTKKPTKRQWPTKKPTKKPTKRVWNNGGGSSSDSGSGSHSGSGSGGDSDSNSGGSSGFRSSKLWGDRNPVVDSVDVGSSSSSTTHKRKKKNKGKNKGFKWDFQPSPRSKKKKKQKKNPRS